MMNVEVRFRVECDDFIPHYQTLSAAGADLMAYILEKVEIDPGSSLLIPTGLYLEIPPGYEVQIRSRSGLASRYGVCVLNSPGTIDSDYRGEIKVILMNHGRERFIVEPKMRIAQMILAPVMRAVFVQSEQLSVTLRGEGGFGHTGLAASNKAHSLAVDLS
jgi:dUTP pyrophosphatase